MNIIISLDYELFFGSKTGDAMDCMVHPTNALANLLHPMGIKMCLFVDAGYLVQLNKFRAQFPELNATYSAIQNQLKQLSENGHEVQLHIHPHWEDCVYANGEWKMNLSRYRLDHFSPREIQDIVNRYFLELEKVAVNKITAYRAGGWSIPPFSLVSKTFEALGIVIDSTVFKEGQYQSAFQSYDFSMAPKSKSRWRFSTQPTLEDDTGRFLEVPIANTRYSPVFYWKLAMSKLFKSAKHRSFGAGRAVKNDGGHLVKLLTSYTNGVVSMDGLKAGVLFSAFRRYQAMNLNDFVIIGHPKAFTPYSLEKFNQFIKRVSRSQFITYNAYLDAVNEV